MCATVYNILRHLFPVLPPLQVDQQVYLTTPIIDKQLHLSTPTSIPSLDVQEHPTTPTTDQLEHLQPPTGYDQVNLPSPATGEPVHLPSPSTNQQVNERFVLTTDWLVFPLLLPSIYPALFNLYIQKEDALDREYWARITRWNKHTDAALLTFFDVDINAWQLQIDRRSRDSVFLEAIYNLQRLKTTFTPAEKLEVIVSVFKCLASGKNGVVNVTLNMDMLLPVCMYIIVRARVLQLGAELHMVDDFIGDHLRQGMEGITFVTLQAAYTQIRRESVFIN